MDAEIAVLRARLSYNPENGQLRWLNGPHAGMSAGYESHSREELVYLNVRINRKNYRLHRVAWALHYGTWPLGVIDHIDGNPKNNAIANLRDVSVRENNTNQYKHGLSQLGSKYINGFIAIVSLPSLFCS